MRFKVEFGKSASAVFQYALELAQKSSTFEQRGHIYSASYDNLLDFTALTRYVHGWKTTRMTIDGRLLLRVPYQSLMWVAECYEKKQEFINRDLYCRVGRDNSPSLVPCRWIGVSGYELRQGKYGSPKIDKSLLSFAIEQLARQSMCYCCPDLDLPQVLKAVEELPDEWPTDDAGDTGTGLQITISPKDEDEHLKRLLRDVDFEE